MSTKLPRALAHDKSIQLVPMAVSVRHATDADMAAVQAIYAHHVVHGLASFETTPPSVAELFERRRALLRLDLPFLIAESVEGLVGYCYAGPYRPRPAYRYTIEDSIYVAPGFEGRGIGAALLESLISKCESGPWRQMIAVIGDSANLGSISLHRKFGFESIGTIRSVGFKFSRWVDTVLMQRALGNGASGLPDDATRHVQAP